MPSIGQSIIQGLATGFSGDVLATDLAKQKLELQTGQRKLKAEEYQTSADKVWSKAIMDVLAGQQTPVAPPTAPQPGQASVPMTQGTAGVPAAAGGGTPTAAGLGGPTPGGAPPSPAAATLQTLGTQPQPQTQPPPIADPMNAASILAKIKADNPNIDPGVLSDVINKHLMPYLDTQQQNNYKQFKQYFELEKFNKIEQDKANLLYLRIRQLEEQIAQHGATADLKAQKAAAKQGLVDLRQKHVKVSDKPPKSDKPPAKLPAAMQQELYRLKSQRSGLISEINNAHSNSELERAKTLEAQLPALDKRIDDLLAKADQLDAQGAPAQPIPEPGTPVGTVKAFKMPDGTPVNLKKTKAGPDDDQGTWESVPGG